MAENDSGELAADDLVLSAHEEGNASVFPKVLGLHVEKGAEVADITYGKGTFWKNVPETEYDVCGTDIDPNKSPCGEAADCRDLPYDDESFDVVVFDPPYAEGFYRRNQGMLAGRGSHGSFREAYSGGEGATSGGAKYHNAVKEMYFEGGREAKRVLRDDGALIVKTQDEVSANTQEMTHVQVINFYERELGFYTKDLFVVVRPNTPHQTGIQNQIHARKNHSYFLVFNFEKSPVNQMPI